MTIHDTPQEHTMTPTNDPREVLDQLDALREVGTKGPWSNPYPFDKLIDGPGPSTNMAMVKCDASTDAALIVAAVNHLPQLTNALRAVLELHEPIELQGTTYCDDDGAVWPCLTYRAVAAPLTPGEVTA